MAILKEIKLEHNFVVAEYHKICKFEYSSADKAMTIVVAQYVSKEARDAGAAPVHHEYIRIPIEAFSTHPAETAYVLLSQMQTQFDGGASDVQLSEEA